MSEDGVMVVNMNMRGSGEGNINQYLADTIAKVFSEVYTVDVRGSTNRELFASNHPGMFEELTGKQASLAQEGKSELADLMGMVLENLRKYEAGEYLLTDDRAPVELLGMQVIDELIEDEVTYYKEIYQEKGIQGLLENF